MDGMAAEREEQANRAAEYLAYKEALQADSNRKYGSVLSDDAAKSAARDALQEAIAARKA